MRVSRILAGVLGAAMALLPIAPPEHMHEGEEEGHAHVVVHRHLKPHGMVEHHADRHLAFDDDDGPILTLTPIYVVPDSVVVVCPAQIVDRLLEPLTPRCLERVSTDFDVPIHGPPPTPTPSRAPPVSPAT